MFEGTRIGLSGLMELELVDHTLRLCDGGMLDWSGRGMFVGIDSEFGTIGGVEPSAEAVGDEAAGGRLTLNVPTTEAAVELATAEMQGKGLRFWLAEVDLETGLLLGTPEKQFEGLVDTVTLSLGRGSREVNVDYIDAGERLFAVREGNVLSSRFHQTAWAGELGFDHCTGAAVAVPWGVRGPPRGRGAFDGASGFFGLFASAGR